jgi:chromosome segregation ATPase
MAEQLTEHVDKLRAILQEIEEDVSNLVVKGHKEAGVRARAKSQLMKTHAHQLRKDITEYTKTLPKREIKRKPAKKEVEPVETVVEEMEAVEPTVPDPVVEKKKKARKGKSPSPSAVSV